MKEECNAVGWNKDEVLVRRADLNKCERVNEYLSPTYTHAGVLLKRYDYSFLNFAFLTFMLSVLFVSSVTYPTMGWNGTIRFLGGYFAPLLLQVIIASVTLKRLVAPLIFPVIAPIPSFLVAYYPYPNVYSPNKFSRTILISTLVAIAAAFILMINNAVPIVASEGVSFTYQPLVSYVVSGTLRPMALGAFSFILATFIALLPYTASIGYYVIRRRNCVVPLVVAALITVVDKNLAAVIFEYAIMAVIMCLFMPYPSVLNLEEEESLNVLLLYAIVASLVTPVVR